MVRLTGDRTVSFRPNATSPQLSSANAPTRAANAVAPGYAQLSPSSSNLRVRPAASHRRPQGGSPTLQATGRGSGGARSDSGFEAPAGTALQRASLLQRRGEDTLLSLVNKQQSGDSMMDIGSTTSLATVSPVGANPGGSFPTTTSRDNVTIQELIALQQHQNNQKGVTVIYPHMVSPTDAQARLIDYASAQEVQSDSDDNANKDREQVRVEGFYDGANVNVLIPNDLPPSTLLYVLTASDGRDLMFKVTQYSLQLIICFLKRPSLFSPEVQVFTGSWAKRLYRNYNTIRHGRSLFKMGRGLLNIFTLQTVCERMWLKYESAISQCTCAALLPVVTRVERLLLLLGASPAWGRSMSQQLLHWSQAAKLTPGQRRLEDSQDSMAMDRHIEERMKERRDDVRPGALMADDTFTHMAEVERMQNANGASSGGAVNDGGSNMHSNINSGGLFQGMANASFKDLAMNAMGFSALRDSAGSKHSGPSVVSSPSDFAYSPADKEKSSPEHSGKASPQSLRGPFPMYVHRRVKDVIPAPASVPDREDSTKVAEEPSISKDTAANSRDNCSTDAKAEETAAASDSKHVKAPVSIPTDDGPEPKDSAPAPPHVHGTMPQPLEHDNLPGMTPSKNTADPAQSTTDPHVGGGEEGGGRMTLLRPLIQSTRHSSVTDPDGSVTMDDGFGMHLDSALHEEALSMPAAAAPNFSSGPMSMPDSWRPAMAPTVPPSQSDGFSNSATLCFADHVGSPPLSLPPPSTKTKDSNSAGGDEAAGAAAGIVKDVAAQDESQAFAQPVREVQRRAKKECPPLEMVPALPSQVVSLPLPPVSVLSSLSAMPKQGTNDELNESEMSILSSETNSSFHVRPDGVSGAMTAWLNELQPASAALPSRARKGILQFNPVLMTLLGIRNIAAGFRRFLRDSTLISTERFMTFNVVEMHRSSITRFINRCWLVISIIDLLLNTVRLLQPGWWKYATARQNIRYRCGCQNDDNPADTVWRTHGFIARRKTDLFFPPLSLDYGAPLVSCISYMEAADPARLMPACSRCGCLYKELPSNVAMLGGEEDADVATTGECGSPSTATGTGLDRPSNASPSLPNEAPLVASSHPSQSFSGDGDRSLINGPLKREKPRWVQLYEAGMQEAEEVRRRTAAKDNKNAMVDAGTAGNTGSGVGARREPQKPSSGTMGNTVAEGASHTAGQGLADFMLPPPIGGAGETVGSADRTGDDASGILFLPWMMRKFFNYVWLLRVHPNLRATILLEARYLAEFYLSYKYCFADYESYKSDAPLSGILHPWGAIAGIVSAAVSLARVVESAPTS
ncbi:hypothetical protein ABL78_6406 [Leptomonas seymouri]|uniref:Uncharacterized protein n=1 Tax=Leptomonas seymouri TaxID=5684 RepID=A0A0N1I243_LEPSE|nr:hypothetical protein ABL78_6406 [Leptomonas seymouri]|eukprot:KPI84544.1 hypothetical protein ABL78_6406 [Leptomonas seymouri]